MIRISLLLFLMALSLQNVLRSQAISDRGKLFIIGGGQKPVSMIKRMVEEADLKGNDYGIILPMSSGEPLAAIQEMRQSFKAGGAENMYGINFDKELLKNSVKIDSVRKAKLIYITGGDQSRFISVVSGTELEAAIKEALKKGCLIAGTSAGAAVMSRIMITGNQLKDTVYNATFKTIRSDNIETSQGLGLLVNAIVDQHFVIRSRHNRLITAILQFPGNTGIGIDESTAILVQGKKATVVGESQVLVFQARKKASPKNDGKYSVRHIQLDIYTDGETFKIGK